MNTSSVIVTTPTYLKNTPLDTQLKTSSSFPLDINTFASANEKTWTQIFFPNSSDKTILQVKTTKQKPGNFDFETDVPFVIYPLPASLFNDIALFVTDLTDKTTSKNKEIKCDNFIFADVMAKVMVEYGYDVKIWERIHKKYPTTGSVGVLIFNSSLAGMFSDILERETNEFLKAKKRLESIEELYPRPSQAFIKKYVFNRKRNPEAIRKIKHTLHYNSYFFYPQFFEENPEDIIIEYTLDENHEEHPLGNEYFLLFFDNFLENTPDEKWLGLENFRNVAPYVERVSIMTHNPDFIRELDKSFDFAIKTKKQTKSFLRRKKEETKDEPILERTFQKKLKLESECGEKSGK